MCTWSYEWHNDDVNNLFPKNSCDTVFQDKKENGCHGNRNAYNTLKIDQMQRKNANCIA